MRASGAGWIHRFIGFGFLGLQAVVLLIPALASLHVFTRGRVRPAPLATSRIRSRPGAQGGIPRVAIPAAGLSPRPGALHLSERWNGCRNTEDGRKDKQDGMSFDRNRLTSGSRDVPAQQRPG
jgi:hypothetical protein